MPRLLFYCVSLIWHYILGRFDGLYGILFSVCLYYVSPSLCILPCSFAYSYFILFLVDVLQSGIWRDANSLVEPSLRRLVPNLLHLELESRAPSTVQKYRSGWLKWRQWAASKIGVQIIPAKPLYVALFISELTEISVSYNTGISSIESVLYGIKWCHNLGGIVESPTTGHPLVKSSLEGARRKLARPVQPKEPLSIDTVSRITGHYISSSSLAVIRFLFYYFSWFRWVLPHGRNS